MSRIPVIKTVNLSIGYLLKGGSKKVIHESLSLELYAGEVTCLLGLNGAGKSTLLRTLCGFQPSLGGTIELQGKPLSEYSQHAFSLMVGVVLTEKTNVGGITVYELASLGRYPYTGFFGQLKKTDHAIICESLAAVGIEHKAGSYVSELSDGERQKAMIAKALAQQCPVILLDEPTAFLDITSRIETMVLLRKLAKEQQKTILLSTHDLEQAIQMSDCLWLQSKDRPMLCGSPEDLILSGSFGTFFERENIHFDINTGKLSAEARKKPVGITGNSVVVYWVSNALVRNGYCPEPVALQEIIINCVSACDIEVTGPSGSNRVTNVAELLNLLSV